MPEDVLQMYLEKLQERFDTHQQEETLQQKLKTQELESSKKRLDRLVDIYLNEDIDKITYDKKKAELTREISLLESQIANFKNNSEDVHISMKLMLKVVSRIYELYMSSEIDRKRKIFIIRSIVL